MLTNIE